MRYACGLLFLATLAQAAPPSAYRLRVEYLENPQTIDVTTPRFSWALQHPKRAEIQTAYRIVVTDAAGGSSWDTGVVQSNKSLNVGYAGRPLRSNTDYSWSVTWYDSEQEASAPATAVFSTALYADSDWQGAEWVSTPANAPSNNIYRASFSLPSAPVRARLFIAGLGYYKAWLNGVPSDDHELGTFTTFEQKVLYDVAEVAPVLTAGCNILAVALGRGWFSQSTVNSGPRQLRVFLSLSFADGTTIGLHSALAGAAGALTFLTTQGPVLADDIYTGETYDGRIAAALTGWTVCGFTPSAAWVPAAAPATSPATLGSILGAHTIKVTTDRTYSIQAITSPASGIFIADFGQNMAGQTEIYVEDCPAGTNITLLHAEILHVDGTLFNNFWPGAKMMTTYFCSGGGSERYRTQFSYFGFRYVQIIGYPGVPAEHSLTAYFIHTDFPQSGEFSSSSAALNAVQHATRFASWSNWMDIPTDCPQRERRGWLGDAQLSFETVIHNIDGGAAYTKWLGDFADTQVYDNRTMHTNGTLPDCIPFYGHGHPSADAGWGIAGWTITDWFSDYYADDVFDVAWYPNMRWNMETWITLAEQHGGLFPTFFWGDWGNYVPGPYAFKTAEYPQFFYVVALEITAKFANRLGYASDAARYSDLAKAARALYISTYYKANTNCFANCTYVSQLFALALDLVPADTEAIWAQAYAWWSADTHLGMAEHFGGGIISLKYLWPELAKRNLTGFGLKMHLQSDRPPGFGFWTETNQATTLWESYDDTSTNGGSSRNHIMFGASGSHYYTNIAGLGRAPSSRSWSSLIIAPAHDAILLAQLTFANAAIDTPMGMAAASWASDAGAAYAGAACGSAPESGAVTLTCEGGQFDEVLFASYGTPTGNCATGFTVNDSCNANTSTAIVSAHCIGKATCTIPVSTAEFGGKDPCLNVVKTLAVAVRGQNCAATRYTLSTTIPVNGVASVIVPTVISPATATITESGTPVWRAGAYVPGQTGITGATAGADNTVTFTVGSGTYTFAVRS